MRSCEQYEEGLMALVDGASGEAERARTEEHLAQCETCRREHAWMKGAVADLEALGQAIVADAPKIDIVEAVMRRHALAAPAPKRVALPRAERPWFWTGMKWGALAAGLALAWWLGVYWQASGPAVGSQTARVTDGTSAVVEPGMNGASSRGQGAATVPRMERIAEAGKLLATTKQSRPTRHERGDRLALPSLATLTVRDVLDAKRESAADNGVGDLLAAWATLSPEDARRLANSPSATLKGLLGACAALSPEEAEPLLRAAAEANPDDPYIRLALATALDEQSGKTAAAEAALADWGDVDPSNALPFYMLARNWLESGDVANGLSALAQAGTRESTDAYTLKAAQNRETALIESGMSSDTARLVTALTAGENEYAVLLDLGQSLIEQGVQFFTEGDLATAQQIFESVYEMGAQVYEQAEFSFEQLAGLDLQRGTVEFLEQIYASIGAQESLAQLAAGLDIFIAQIQELGAFFDSLNNLFANLLTENNQEAIANLILQAGDLSLFQDLPTTTDAVQ